MTTTYETRRAIRIAFLGLLNRAYDRRAKAIHAAYANHEISWGDFIKAKMALNSAISLRSFQIEDMMNGLSDRQPERRA